MIKAQGLQLYTQSRNSAGERVRIALNLKGLQYEYIPVSAMTSEEYRSVNPQGLMPALRVGNSVFAQSTAILEYLEEAYPHPPLLPADPIARAEARAFSQLISSDTQCNYRVRSISTPVGKHLSPRQTLNRQPSGWASPAHPGHVQNLRNNKSDKQGG